MNSPRPVEVAVGILFAADGRFLLAQRPEGKPCAGQWEFPGGKLEPRESIAEALRRELHEELGLDIGEVCPWVTREHVYPHAHVRLHFCRVYDWRGEPHAREGQHFGFFSLARLPWPLLEGAMPVMPWLSLPERCVLGAPAASTDEGVLHLAAAADGDQGDEWVEIGAQDGRRGQLVADAPSARRALAGAPGFLIAGESAAPALLTRAPVPVYLLSADPLAPLAAARRRGAHGLARFATR